MEKIEDLKKEEVNGSEGEFSGEEGDDGDANNLSDGDDEG